MRQRLAHFLFLKIKIPEDQRGLAYPFGNLAHWGKVRLEDAETCPQCSPFLPFLCAFYLHSILTCRDPSAFFWCLSVSESRTLKLILLLVIIPADCLWQGLKLKSYKYKVKPLFWQQQPQRKLIRVCVQFLRDGLKRNLVLEGWVCQENNWFHHAALVCPEFRNMFKKKEKKIIRSIYLILKNCWQRRIKVSKTVLLRCPCLPSRWSPDGVCAHWSTTERTARKGAKDLLINLHLCTCFWQIVTPATVMNNKELFRCCVF